MIGILDFFGLFNTSSDNNNSEYQYAKGGDVGDRTSLSEEEKQFIREESQDIGQGYTYRAKILFGQPVVLKEKNNAPIKKWGFYNFEIAKKIAEKLNNINKHADGGFVEVKQATDREWSDSYANGGGVENKQKYEIVFEDVFSFATAKREVEWTDSQYKRALELKADNVIVVDKYDASKGIREQLRIKDIKPKYANGGAIGSGKNGYIAMYRGKKVEVYADTKYEAQQKAAQHFKAKKSYEVDVYLAELDGKQYVTPTNFATGGSITTTIPETIEFNYKGNTHKLTFTPEEEDWWTAFESNDLEFDVHYDENYGTISVYEVIGNKADLSQTVYTKQINKEEKIKQYVASMSDEEVLQDFNTIYYYELQDNDEYPFEDVEKARTELIKHYSEDSESAEVDSFAKGGNIKEKPKTYYYAIRSKVFKEWSEHPQQSFTGTWKQMVSLAKQLAVENKTEVRVSNSEGYSNQGYYFHWQSIFEKGGTVAYKKDWEVIGITFQGKPFKKTITLGRQSDEYDVKQQLKRMTGDVGNIREVTSIKLLRTY